MVSILTLFLFSMLIELLPSQLDLYANPAATVPTLIGLLLLLFGVFAPLDSGCY